MQERSINNNIKNLEEFKKHQLEQGWYLYAVTLTYGDVKLCKKKHIYEHSKLPKQKIAINKDMKKLRDNLVPYCNRNGCKIEYIFVYSKHIPERRPHFHGIIALSEKRFPDKEGRKYWGNGFVCYQKIYDIEGWINYIKYNIELSKRNYEDNLQIISRVGKN